MQSYTVKNLPIDYDDAQVRSVLDSCGIAIVGAPTISKWSLSFTTAAPLSALQLTTLSTAFKTDVTNRTASITAD